MNSATLAQIKLDEGLELTPYTCPAGKLTIGYGRNLEEAGISEAEAETLLENDIERIEQQLQSLSWFQSLNEARQSVLIQMVYQLGFRGLYKFNKMRSALKQENFEEASRQMLDSLWAEQTPRRAERLAQQMKEGIWCKEG